MAVGEKVAILSFAERVIALPVQPLLSFMGGFRLLRFGGERRAIWKRGAVACAAMHHGLALVCAAQLTAGLTRAIASHALDLPASDDAAPCADFRAVDLPVAVAELASSGGAQNASPIVS